MKEKFQELLDRGLEDKVQACAFVNGQVVVNLVGTYDPKDNAGDATTDSDANRTYSNKSIQNVYSSTKAVSSIVMSMLVDRESIKYESRIAEVWPEFAQHGMACHTVCNNIVLQVTALLSTIFFLCLYRKGKHHS